MMKTLALKCRKMGDETETIVIKTQKLLKSSVKESFRIVVITLLSLLVPLSFLILARISRAKNNLIENDMNLLSSLPLTNPVPLYLLVSLIAVFTLVKTLNSDESGTRNAAPSTAHINASRIALCALQAGLACSVGALEADLSGLARGPARPGGAGLFFLVGLHEATRHWTSAVVWPVVDDAMPDLSAVSWARHVAVAGALEWFWWWRLRDEVAAAEGVWDFSGWWVYYLTVAIGVVRVLKGLTWLWARLVSNVNAGYHASSRIVMIVSDGDELEHICLNVDDDAHSSESDDDVC